MKPLINDYSFISLIKIDCMQKNFHIFVINYTIKKKGLPNITRGCWAQIGFDPQNFRISPRSWNGCWSLKWHLGNEASLCSQSVAAFQQCCHAAAYDLEENSSALMAHERLKLHCSKGRIFLKHARLDSSDFIGFIQDLVMIQKVSWFWTWKIRSWRFAALPFPTFPKDLLKFYVLKISVSNLWECRPNYLVHVGEHQPREHLAPSQTMLPSCQAPF